METFTAPKELTENPHFKGQRQKNLAALRNAIIDEPIREIIKGFNKSLYCFTMQSCYGHFLYNGQKYPHNIDHLPVKKTIFRVEDRIAYLAFCIENSDSGRRLFEMLEEITDIDPQNIQFCCAEWL